MTARKVVFLVTEDWYFWSHRLPMARAARDAGFEVVVVTKVADHGQLILAEGFRLHPLLWRRRSLNPLESLRALIDIIRIYRRERPDVVHHVALKPVLFGALAAQTSGRPVMVNALTGLGYSFVATTLRARLLRLLIRGALKLLVNRPRSCVLLQNPDDLAALVAAGTVDRSRTRLVRGSGIDISHFQPLPTPTGPVTCAIVSRMLTIKGVAILVEAVRLVRSRGVDLRLILAGTPDPDSPAAIDLRQLKRWSDEPGIRWLGHVADVRDVWREAHIAVQPSLGGEGIPKSLLEAAACARPIIVSDVSGCREVVVDGVNGTLVPPGNAEALADALKRLVNDPVRRHSYGLASRTMVESDLAAEAVGQQIVSIYVALIGESSDSARASATFATGG